MGSRPPLQKSMINPQIKKNTHFIDSSLGSIALREFLHVALVSLSVLILQVKEHLGVIVMGSQPSSDAFAEILVKGTIVVEA